MEEHITAESVSAEFDRLIDQAGPDPEVLASEKVEQQVAAGLDEGVAEYKALLAQLFTPGFAILAPNWKVTEGAIDALSESYARLIYKYIPTGLSDFGPELGAVLTTAAIIVPLAGVPRVAPVEESGEEAKDGDS